MSSNTILAYDPSLTGFGIVQATSGWHIQMGCVVRSTADSSKDKTEDVTRRVRKLGRNLDRINQACEPDLIVAEFPLGYMSKASAKAAGYVIATIIRSASRYDPDTPIEWIQPTQMKKLSTGSGSATKQDVIDAACEEFAGLEEILSDQDYKYETENIGEAAGVLLAAKRSSEMAKMLM